METWENRRRNPHQLLPIGPSTPLWSLSNSMVCLMQTTHGNATPPKMRLRTSREAREVVHILPSNVKELRLGRGWLAGHEICGCPPSQTEKHTFATSGKMDHSHESLSCNAVCTVKTQSTWHSPGDHLPYLDVYESDASPNSFKNFLELSWRTWICFRVRSKNKIYVFSLSLSLYIYIDIYLYVYLLIYLLLVFPSKSWLPMLFSQAFKALPFGKSMDRCLAAR